MKRKFKKRSRKIHSIRNIFTAYMIVCGIFGTVNFLQLHLYNFVGFICVYTVTVIIIANVIANRKIQKIEEDNHGFRSEYARSGKTSQKK